ncbi:MAG TPA: metallophosphoesterase [Thermoanaerobaculia bacterium]|nr:metallophosphoesterase [Thermoanaerobaculia bacterium]
MKGSARKSASALVVAVAGASFLALACAGGRPSPFEPAPEAKGVETTLFFIGDAGAPGPKGEPVLRALTAEAGIGSVVVFLGDNVYPRGVPAERDPTRKLSESRLAQQMAVKENGARVLFIPGNHDWAAQGPDGWEAIKRQEKLVAAAGLEFLPGGGCPGPVIRDVSRTARIVALDTQWWLHKGPRPTTQASGCAPFTEEGVVTALRKAIESAEGRKVFVVGHHPMLSGGVHGGHFTFAQHVLPLLEVSRWLWLPLPFIGSIYPGGRWLGASVQDISSAKYRHLVSALERAFTPAPPTLYASGHDHSLQVLRGTAVRHLLVSGAGTYGDTTPVALLSGTRFARSEGGFMKLEVTEAGAVRLSVRVATASGVSREVYSAWLD